MSKDWIIEAELKEIARQEAECIRLHEEEIAKSRVVIEQLKADIKENISKFDYDSLEEIEAMLRTEKITRPEDIL